jgi:hypothetical protein
VILFQTQSFSSVCILQRDLKDFCFIVYTATVPKHSPPCRLISVGLRWSEFKSDTDVHPVPMSALDRTVPPYHLDVFVLCLLFCLPAGPRPQHEVVRMHPSGRCRQVTGLALSCKRRICSIFLFGRTLRIRSFNYFNVCT